MDQHSLVLLLLLFFSSMIASCGSAFEPPCNTTTRYIEITHTLPTESQRPIAVVSLFKISLGAGSAVFTGTYSAPTNCCALWKTVVMELSASINSRQNKRIAGVWINGVEILRTSTVQIASGGAVWKVAKDVTRYRSVFSRSNSTTAALAFKDVEAAEEESEAASIGGANVTGTFFVNVTLNFYGGICSPAGDRDGKNASGIRKLGFWGEDTAARDRILMSSASEDQPAELLPKEMALSSKGENSEFLWNRLKSSQEEEVEEEEEEEEDRDFAGIFQSNTAVTEPDFFENENRNRKQISEFPFNHENENKRKANIGLPSGGGSSGSMGNRLKSIHLYPSPADVVIPISSKANNVTGAAPWFFVHNSTDLQIKEIQIPNNTYKAVIEIYVSSHGKDELWFSNPPNTYLERESPREPTLNGAFRQVFAALDGLYVGSIVPFPLIYSDGINPMFWDPIVPIGAFDLPSFDLDLTPFLGHLLDGKPHSIGLGVSDSAPYWLVTGNLHLWSDPVSAAVTGKLVSYRAPEIKFSRKYKFGEEKEKFKIKAERELVFAGWVNSSFGNLTTHIETELEFESEIEMKRDGSFKEVEQKLELETEVKVEKDSRITLAKVTYKSEYPLKMKIKTEKKGENADLSKTSFSHGMEERSSGTVPSGRFSVSLKNRQESEGRTLLQGQEILSGMASTEQKYNYRDPMGCFMRNVVGSAGHILEDSLTNICVEEF